jgi:microcystin-dependent protein
MADNFRTGNGLSGQPVSYLLTLSNDDWFVREFSDLMRDITMDINWTKSGDVTVEQAVQLGMRAYWSLATMVGQCFPVVTENMPANMLECDGAVYDRVDYPALYAILDPFFILDEDTFKVPDLRGKAAIGRGTGTGLTPRSVGDTGGEETHQLTVGELASHHHAYDPIVIQDVDLEDLGLPQGNAAQILPGTENTYDTGSDEAHNNMPPFLALRWGIVAW